MEKTLSLHFRSTTFKLVIDGADELFTRLKNDFSHFLAKTEITAAEFNLTLHWGAPPAHVLPQMVVSQQRAQCLTFDHQGRRYNDYYGEVLSICDFQKKEMILYSQNLHRAHEVTYLLVLSFVGKAWDLKGEHRLHAFALAKEGVALVGMMPMKGGKSTLFCDLVTDPQVSILSDDSPLVDCQGRIHPLPLRVGMEAYPSFVEENSAAVTVLERKEYGRKYLIALEAFKRPIATEVEHVILFRGRRSSFARGQVRPCPKIFLFKDLFINLAIGLGLPMIREYYLRPGPKDFFLNIKIFCSRLKAMLFLLARAKTYDVILGHDKKDNARMLRELWQQHLPEDSLAAPELRENART